MLGIGIVRRIRGIIGVPSFLAGLMKNGAVQVEVSTRCQLNCVMCPKSVFNDWISENMSMDVFTAIPFDKFEYAHLQGWGEPLLNPKLPEMIEHASRFCKVGLTTNGVLADRFIESLRKLDIIVFSVASPIRKVNTAIRGSDLDKIGTCMRKLCKDVKVVVNTLMLSKTVNQIPELVRFAAENGAEEVIANNLDYIPHEKLICKEVFDKPEIADDVEKVRRMAEDAAEEYGIKFVMRDTRSEEALVCAENPIKNCLITVNGFVSPCVYLHLPTKGEKITRYFRGGRVDVGKVYFGNLRTESFDEIWEKKEYVGFRRVFEMRLANVPDIFNYKRGQMSLPELPEVCRSCYKAYSL